MESIKQLFKYFPVVKKYIRAHSGSKMEAEDVFQEALLIYPDKLHSFMRMDLKGK
jgi:hypothetical protein